MRDSIVRRCLLISVLLIAVVACSSNTSSRAITTMAFGRTTTTTSAPATSHATTHATTDATTDATTSTVAETTTTALPPLATTTTIELATVGAVVKVANATEVENAATRLTQELATAGFTVAEPTNGAGKDEALEVSKIYAKAGSEATAESVSYLMGGIEISRMPTPAWIFGGTAALGDTTVLVMLGADLAAIPLQSMRFDPGRQGPD